MVHRTKQVATYHINDNNFCNEVKNKLLSLKCVKIKLDFKLMLLLLVCSSSSETTIGTISRIYCPLLLDVQGCSLEISIINWSPHATCNF